MDLTNRRVDLNPEGIVIVSDEKKEHGIGYMLGALMALGCMIILVGMFVGASVAVGTLVYRFVMDMLA